MIQAGDKRMDADADMTANGGFKAKKNCNLGRYEN